MIVETPKGRVYRRFFNANTGKVANSLTDAYAGEPFSQKSLTWYLSIGYVPGDLTLFENIFCLPGGAKCEVQVGGYKVLDRFYYEDLIDKDKYKDCNREELLREAHEILLKVVESEFKKDPNMALALTGGLDSRLLLGALLEITDAKKINTFSWGFKDTYDFEIGKNISKSIGIAHRSYDLMSLPFGNHELELFCKVSDASTNFFDAPPYQSILNDFYDHTIWYGVLGGAASGVNLPYSSLESPETFFLRTEKSRVGVLSDLAYSVLGESINVEDVLLLISDYKNRNYDMIDIYNHHERLIGSTLFFGDHKYSIPFASDEWLGLFLSIDPMHRGITREFLKHLICQKYRFLSKFPSANNHGMGVKSTKSEYLLFKVKQAFTNKGKNRMRKKFLSIEDVVTGTKATAFDPQFLLPALNNVIAGGGHFLTLLLQEVGNKRLSHWKSIELLLSLAVTEKVYSRK